MEEDCDVIGREDEGRRTVAYSSEEEEDLNRKTLREHMISLASLSDRKILPMQQSEKEPVT
jgi:hypothetical protein